MSDPGSPETDLPAEWYQATFGECAVLVRDSVSPSDFADEPYVGLEHIGEGTLALVDGCGIAADVGSTKSRFESGDILFGKLRPYFRKVIQARFGGICSTDIWVVRPTEGIDAGYLFYAMASQEFVDAATRGSEGTKMPRAKWDFVSRIQLPLPPLEEQRVIARVLGALDDKIELNRRMSETLEEMARALFRSWFVDFDPVRAKAEGRPSGLPPDLDALFPASFEASEMGEIPAGWEVKTLGDVAVDRRVAVSPEAIAPETPYIGLDHMPRRSIALSEWSTAEGLASNKSSFEQGDILFGKLRPYFHKVGVATVGGVCSTDIVVLSPKSSEWFGFVLGHASSDEFVNYTDAVSTGTKMPRTKWKDMARYGVPAPRESIVAAFNERAHACVTRIATAIHESRVLAGERDALLPRLVSGKYRVTRGDGVPK